MRQISRATLRLSCPGLGRRPEGQPAVDAKRPTGNAETVLQCMSASATGSLAPMVTALGLVLSACQEPDPPSAPPPSETQEPLVCEGTKPGPATLRLLTRTQYDNTVFDLLGDDSHPAQTFPPEHRVENFENN